VRIVFATLLSFMVIGLWPTAGADAKIVGCNVKADFNIVISSAKGISCEGARKEMRRYKGSIARTFKTPGGYSCKRVSGARLGGQWRCTKGKSRAFRFEFSD
jgi:hypothetical protein